MVFYFCNFTPQGRTALYYAVLSGNETIVKTFLKLSHCNEPDSLWVRTSFLFAC